MIAFAVGLVIGANVGLLFAAILCAAGNSGARH